MLALLKLPPQSITEVTGPFSFARAAASGRERRMFPRKECHASVESRRLDHSIPARQQPQLTLSLRDLSVGGLSAVSQLPLVKGERVAVYFPPEGIQRGWDACGRVIRCEPAAMGYRVDVEFDPLPAAA